MKKTLSILSVFTLIIFLSNCRTIDRGVVKNSPSIKFADKDITLEPDQFFSLDKLGLKDNKLRMMRSSAIISLHQKQSIISYPITMEYNNKKYFGRIAFFQHGNFGKKDRAVLSYYKITVPPEYFASASDGRTSCVYEYWNVEPKIAPTWVIWLSDIPL